MYWIIITGRQCTHRGKTSDRHRRYSTLSTPADHCVSISAFDQSKAVSDRMSTGRAGGGSSRVRPTGAVTDGDVAGSEIHDRRNDKEWRYAVWTGIQKLFVLTLDGPEIADAGTYIGPDHVGVGLVDNESA